MFDIQQMSNKYGLSPTQFEAVKASFDKLPADKQTSFAESDFQALLKNQGWQVYNMPGADQPVLKPPTMTGGFDLSKLDLTGGGTATPGAAIMALLTRDAAEQRQINKEIIFQQTESIVEDIKSQAEDIRDKAIAQLVCGVVSGAISIGQGAVSVGMSASALKASNTVKTDADGWQMYQTTADGPQGVMKLDSSQLNVKNTQIGGFSTAMGGAGQIVGSVGQFLGGIYDSKIKETDAKIEQTRAAMDVLKAFNDSLTELIQKSLSTATDLQASANQTRQKILG